MLGQCHGAVHWGPLRLMLRNRRLGFGQLSSTTAPERTAEQANGHRNGVIMMKFVGNVKKKLCSGDDISLTVPFRDASSRLMQQ